MTRTIVKLLSIFALALVGASCRGGISEKPPIHPVLDMDFQQKVKAQMALDFDYWSDGRGMRTPPEGTVARGSLADDPLEVYQAADGSFVDNPIAATREVVLRGQQRFNIYCAVCHDRSGGGKGVVLQRAQLVSKAAFNYAVPNLGSEQRLVESKDGYFYQVITKGQGTMPAYGHQIPIEDRWAIVHYLRVLQNRFQ